MSRREPHGHRARRAGQSRPPGRPPQTRALTDPGPALPSRQGRGAELPQRPRRDDSPRPLRAAGSGRRAERSPNGASPGPLLTFSTRMPPRGPARPPRAPPGGAVASSGSSGSGVSLGPGPGPGPASPIAGQTARPRAAAAIPPRPRAGPAPEAHGASAARGAARLRCRRVRLRRGWREGNAPLSQTALLHLPRAWAGAGAGSERPRGVGAAQCRAPRAARGCGFLTATCVAASAEMEGENYSLTSWGRKKRLTSGL